MIIRNYDRYRNGVVSFKKWYPLIITVNDLSFRDAPQYASCLEYLATSYYQLKSPTSASIDVSHCSQCHSDDSWSRREITKVAICVAWLPAGIGVPVIPLHERILWTQSQRVRSHWPPYSCQDGHWSGHFARQGTSLNTWGKLRNSHRDVHLGALEIHRIMHLKCSGMTGYFWSESDWPCLCEKVHPYKTPK